MLSTNSAIEEKIATPEPSSAPDIIFLEAEILACSYAVIPEPSVVVITLSSIFIVCFIDPVCLNLLVLTAAQLTVISEFVKVPEDSSK